MTVLSHMDSRKEEWVTLDEHFSSGLVGLQTDRSSQRLNQIDRVRAKGVGDHIPLPQLVVCGDQSAGKSSVLEGITNIPFPRQEGLCTRFATEIILRHQPECSRITATILPSTSRTEEERLDMSSFERQLVSFDDLPQVIQEASALMGLVGISGATCHDLPTFAADVLRLEVVGDTKLHLTVVDLPGLISVSENTADVQIVADLVDKYLESSRTIILAVVPAANDIDTQGIIQRARKFDPIGERTVGIITKPDLINKGAESRVACLASNKDRVKLKLGFFLLKNPSPNELQESISWTERQKREIQFFACSPWKEQSLDRARIGVEKLRSYLQQLLDSHIERELPRVRKDVRMLLSDTERQLVQIGPERSSSGQIRMYLVQIGMEFHNIVKAAIDGNYDDRDREFFNKAGTRLRARVHIENENFSTCMRTKSAKRKICENIGDITENSAQSADSDGIQDSIVSEGEDGEGQLRLTRKEMIGWVKEIYLNTRGPELPGNYSYVLLSELFHEQSSLWGDIAEDHLQKVYSLVERFVDSVLKHIITDDQVRTSVKFCVRQPLDFGLQNAQEELRKILSDEKTQPITYNHYYTDNIQRARADVAKKDLQNSIDHTVHNDWNGKLHVSNNSVDLKKFSSALKSRVVVDMTQQACIESLAALDAYYKVAMKTFVDNISRQVIERHLLNNLAVVFDPIRICGFSDDEVLKIAAETVSVRDRRTELELLRKALQESLIELQD